MSNAWMAGLPKGITLETRWDRTPQGYSQENLYLVDRVSDHWCYWPVLRNPVRFYHSGCRGGDAYFPTPDIIQFAVQEILQVRQ